MRPIVTPEEMKAIDEAAPEPVEVLVERAGAAVARAALRMLGGGYGRRVVVVAGKGNNGADGRAAAARLVRRGVGVQVVDAAAGAPAVGPCDLVIDAAYGTGFRGEYRAPEPGGAPVLAVDIPSGVDGLTGEAGAGAVRADHTVTFAALKPGLLLGEGPERSGQVEVADIGLDVSSARAALVDEGDLGAWLPPPVRDSHKWRSAVYVVAGSPGMAGAAHLCARATMRAGAGTVRLAIPGVAPLPPFLEVVGRSVPATGWDADVAEDSARAKAVIVGPGLSRTDSTAEAVRSLLPKVAVPMVLDADGLFALGTAEEAADVLRQRSAPTVLTPHDGEFKRLTGHPPGADRLAAARDLAGRTGATVLLKGSTTVVADPDGSSLLANQADARLASAGTGDVLAGVLGALLAQGLPPLRAAGLAAYVHGAAGNRGWRRGLVAGDLLDALPAVLDEAGAG
ncbi:MAG: NAD(P)H-hydrate dehydratase [Acidimicrobiia bacterium]